MRKNQPHEFADARYAGILIALFIMAAWAGSLASALQFDTTIFPVWGSIAAVLLQTFLYTGLFITAHDAMHGLVAPQHKRLNHLIGAVSVFLYALFSFRRLKTEHHKHHAHPGSVEDPDYHDGEHRSFWRWYFHFMLTYVTWQQLVGMALAFNVLHHLLHVPIGNLLLFWVAPSLLSTLQLFYFGTYLPHREPVSGYRNEHRAESNNFSVLWSFLTCYHFGYHWEHHEYPYVPWWKLPAVRKKLSRV
ncbi:fatty acid desaturase [candidate division KSB1 bacterium]|nr:fatty acid desaturase [candidate division KSB1 bacterium]